MASIAFPTEAGETSSTPSTRSAQSALSPRRSQAVSATLRVSKTPFRTENESLPKRVRGRETEEPKLAFRLANHDFAQREPGFENLTRQ
jgi:hypothetical protein